MVSLTKMGPSHECRSFYLLLSAAARAAIALTALVGTASLATGLAFSQSALPMRGDGIMRQLPALASSDHRVDVTAPPLIFLPALT